MEAVVLGVPAEVSAESFLAFAVSFLPEGTHIVTATDHNLASTLVSNWGSQVNPDLDHRFGAVLPKLRKVSGKALAVVSTAALQDLLRELGVEVQGEEVIGVDVAAKRPVLMHEYQQYCEENRLKRELSVHAKSLFANFTPIHVSINDSAAFQQSIKSTLQSRLIASEVLIEDCQEAISSVQTYEPLLALLSIRLRTLQANATRLSSAPTTLSLLESLQTRFNSLQRCLAQSEPGNSLYLEKQPSGHLLVVNFLWESQRDVTVLIETGAGSSQDSDPFDLEPGAQLLNFATFPATILSLRFLRAGKPISPAIVWSTGKNVSVSLPFQALMSWQSHYPPLSVPSASIVTFVTPQEQALYGQIHDMLPDLTQTDSDYIRFIRVVKRVGDLTEVNRIVEDLISAGE